MEAAVFDLTEIATAQYRRAWLLRPFFLGIAAFLVVVVIETLLTKGLDPIRIILAPSIAASIGLSLWKYWTFLMAPTKLIVDDSGLEFRGPGSRIVHMSWSAPEFELLIRDRRWRVAAGLFVPDSFSQLLVVMNRTRSWPVTLEAFARLREVAQTHGLAITARKKTGFSPFAGDEEYRFSRGGLGVTVGNP